MKCPSCNYETDDAEFEGFEVWLSQVGKFGPRVKGGKNAIIRVCPKCGTTFLPIREPAS
ncbi:MAG: hypothetical protein ACREBS_06355 [Nitrososphaerales archaeon]